MAVNQTFIIRKLQNLEEMYVAYSAVTRMPFATCDEETFNDQVWIFTKEDKIKEFAQSYKEKHILILPVKVQKAQAKFFYTNLFTMGINEIVFTDGDVESKLELTSVVRMPDYSKLPDNQKPLLNPQLSLSATYFLQELRRPDVEPDREKLIELEEEMSVNMLKSKFLMPVDLQGDGKGKNIRMIYVQNKKGEKFQPVFSDTGELMKHYQGKNPQQQIAQVGFDKLLIYLLKDVDGYVLNPEGINLIIKKSQIEFIMKKYGNR